MPCLDSPPYDVVVFLLDDMRADQLGVLEETLERLEPEAVRFDRAYVSTPMCCPERASFLSGGWLPQSTGVLTNEAPMGGATAFSDANTLPVRLQGAGYSTALIGKYLNEYADLGLYVPPGWSRWSATIGEEGWFDYESIEGVSTPGSSAAATRVPRDGYITDGHGAEALRLLELESPLFLYVAFHAPHDPHLPHPRDRDAWPGFSWRGGAYEEADLSDKPPWMQAIPLLSAEEAAAFDATLRERQQTLLAADRAMAAVIDAVRASDRADRTVFVLSSDNGLMWREHRLDAKGVAYEESVRVPLLVAHPTLSPRAIAELVAANLDLAATVQALAGLPVAGDGVDLRPALCGEGEVGRAAVLLQAWDTGHGSWSAIVSDTRKLIAWDDGFIERYDLAADPSELESLPADPSFDALAEQLAAGRGLAILPTLPGAAVGQPYAAALSAWGGVAPLTWSLTGDPPPGLRLSAGGVLEGIPEEAGEYTLRLRLTDSGVSPVHEGPQWVEGEALLRVVPAPASRCDCAGERAGLGGLLAALWGWKRGRNPRVAAVVRGRSV